MIPLLSSVVTTHFFAVLLFRFIFFFFNCINLELLQIVLFPILIILDYAEHEHISVYFEDDIKICALIINIRAQILLIFDLVNELFQNVKVFLSSNFLIIFAFIFDAPGKMAAIWKISVDVGFD